MTAQPMPSQIPENLAETVNAYVFRALLSKAKAGDSVVYNNFLDEFSVSRRLVEKGTEPDATVMLVTVLNALSRFASYCRLAAHKTLVDEVMRVRPWTSPQNLRLACLEFLSDLVASNSSFMLPVLEYLVSALLPPIVPSALGSAPQVPAPWQPDELTRQVQSDVLKALSKILTAVPSAFPHLVSCVGRAMPPVVRPGSQHCAYVAALLSLAESSAGVGVRDELLALVVEHVVSLDAEIRWEDIPGVTQGLDDDIEPDEPAEDIFALEGMLGLSLSHASAPDLAGTTLAGTNSSRQGWEGPGAGPCAPEPAAEARRGLSEGGNGQVVDPVKAALEELVNTCDSLMELVLRHLQQRCDSGGIASVWSTLLAVFDRTLLRTPRSKFSQYTLFFVASRDPARCSPQLLDVLLRIIEDHTQAPITRVAAAAYLASFLARARFVPPSMLISALKRLVAAAAKSARSASLPGSSGSSVLQHQVHYASCQALLYVLCYHLTPIIKSGGREEASALKSLVAGEVRALLANPLTPLAAMLPSVVAEFSSQTRKLGVMDCETLIPAGSTSPRSQRPLEMFFPFDPYLLCRSSKLLQLPSTYIRWSQRVAASSLQAGANLEAAGAVEEESEEEEEEGDVAEAATSDDDDEDEDELHENDILASSSDEGSDLIGGSSPGSEPDLISLSRQRRRPHHPHHSCPYPSYVSHPDSRHLYGGSPESLRHGAEDMAASYSPGSEPQTTLPMLVAYPYAKSITPSGTSPVAMSITPEQHNVAKYLRRTRGD